VYLAPLGLWLTLDSGQFERVTLDKETSIVELRLAPADAYTPAARLRVEQPAQPAGAVEAGTFAPLEKLSMERGAYVIPLNSTSVSLRLGSHPAAAN
jgi:hypothetical protein